MTFFGTRGGRVLKPLEAFLRVETASGIVLLAATVAALVWANSPWSAAYVAIWHAPTSHFVINDVLMTAFFFVVGLEIRRETREGTLATVRTAALPVVAALGGIAVPAAIYLAFNWAEDVRAGWAIPTATDIAFAVGVLALIGRRANPALRAVLLALAIADDVAAILIIAFFYAGGIALNGTALAALALAGFVALRLRHTEGAVAYFVFGAVLWIGFLYAGLHPVLAGVIVGVLMPDAAAGRLETTLHPWVAFGVMPLFALANAGVSFAGLDLGSDVPLMLAGGIALALFAGKPIGIVAAVALAVRARWCELPFGVTWRGLVLVGCLGGIGFTMSIFIATLAFSESLLAAAKLGVLVASVLAGTTAWLVGYWGAERATRA
jgi:NhaA family Na+:H+ antiporter